MIFKPRLRTRTGWKTLSVVLILLVTLTIFLGNSTATFGQTKPKGLIIEPPPASDLNIRIWTPKSMYRIGEYLNIYFTLNQQAYVYIIDFDTTGSVKLAYPNKYSQDNTFNAGLHKIPDGSYQFRVEGPPGTEYIEAIASTKKINVYEFVKYPNNPFTEDFPTIPNPEAFKQEITSGLKAGFSIKFGGDEGPKAQFKITPVKWSSDYYSFQVGSGTPANQPPVARFDYSPANPNIGTRVSFDASASYDNDGYIRSYLWDFNNDGRTDTSGQIAYHTFNSYGDYRVNLTVRDNDGATSDTSRTVNVSQPEPQFVSSTANSFYSNGRRQGEWYWLESWNDQSTWSFSPRVLPANYRNGYLNFHLQITNSQGGGGLDTSVDIRMYNSRGSLIESGTVNLENPFRPQFSGNTNGVGYDVYGAYRVRNLTEISNRSFEVKLSWPGADSNYLIGTSSSSITFAFTR